MSMNSSISILSHTLHQLTPIELDAEAEKCSPITAAPVAYNWDRIENMEGLAQCILDREPLGKALARIQILIEKNNV